MGDLDIFLASTFIIILGLIVYLLITSMFWRNFFQRFGVLKNSRKDFYECGFRPQNQKPIQVPVQFLLVCAFFLLYDIELIFLFPWATGLHFKQLWDIIIIIAFFLIIILTFFLDFDKKALEWQYF